MERKKKMKVYKYVLWSAGDFDKYFVKYSDAKKEMNKMFASYPSLTKQDTKIVPIKDFMNCNF
tara:strand:- start:211 stop:399 length:189 start_codon:yes stop_codon:yes gene_type:complete